MNMIDKRDGVQHRAIPTGPEYFPQSQRQLPGQSGPGRERSREERDRDR